MTRQIMIKCHGQEDRRRVAGILADQGVDVTIDTKGSWSDKTYWIVLQESSTKVEIVK